MHVAVVSQNAPLETDIRPRAEAAALADAGYDVTLVGGTEDIGSLRMVTDERVAIAAFPQPPAASGALGQVAETTTAGTRLLRELISLSRRRRIDVVHAANPPDDVWPMIPVLTRLQRHRVEFVYDQHDVAPVLVGEKYGEEGAMALVARAASWLERSSFARASLVVFAADQYERRGRELSLLRSPSVVVPHGWRLPSATPNASWRNGAAGLVAYVGTTNEQDCIVHLVDAIAHVPESHGCRVVVAGDGSARAAAERRAAELGIGDRFEWLGWVRDRSRIASLVRSADVCVAPEIESEFNRLANFVKLVEYMSAGAPMVAHRLPQNERLCGDSIRYANGMTAANLGEAIASLLADRTAARELAVHALARFDAEIAWEHVGAPRLVSAYAEAFDAGAGRE